MEGLTSAHARRVSSAAAKRTGSNLRRWIAFFVLIAGAGAGTFMLMLETLAAI